MGRIEFLGLLDENFSFGKIDVPNNAHAFVGKFDNFNILNWILFSLPIILVFILIAVNKHKKYGVLNKEKWKEESIAKYNLDTQKRKILFGIKRFFKAYFLFFALSILIMVVHEFLHAFVGMCFGADMKVAIIPGGAIAITSTALTRTQYLIMLLTPVILLGIIPSILLAILYNRERATSFKNSFVAWFCMCLLCGMIFSASPDIISTYNVLNEIPKDAIMRQTDENMYWYIIKETYNLK